MLNVLILFYHKWLVIFYCFILKFFLSCAGNLRDQIIYPDTYADMINKQITEEDLLKIMRMVHLEHIVERDSFHVVKDWTDILSGGEKQRMAIARLFYHK